MTTSTIKEKITDHVCSMRGWLSLLAELPADTVLVKSLDNSPDITVGLALAYMAKGLDNLQQASQPWVTTAYPTEKAV